MKHAFIVYLCRMAKHINAAEFFAKAKALHGDTIDYSETVFVNLSSWSTFICPVHGSFQQRAYNHIKGSGCRRCYEQSKCSTASSFVSKAILVHGARYDYSQVKYVNSYVKVTIACKDHGPFNQWPTAHINQAQGCPRCKESKGELAIAKWLEHHGVAHERQKRFTDCRHIRPLPFDFFVPSKSLCIEYDGYQHFHEAEQSKIRGLSDIQRNDSIKTKFCLQVNLNLLRIKYSQINNISHILNQAICP